MKRVICFLLLAALLISLAACGEKPEADDDTYPIETPYGTLRYPQKWQAFTRTEENGNAVSFYGWVAGKSEQPLFTLQFGEGDGYLLGTFHDTPVYIVDGEPVFDETWSEAEKETIYTMQEDVNVILRDFTLQAGTAQPQSIETFTVDSPIGALPYPEKWRDQIKTEQTDHSVAFYAEIGDHEPLLLFTLQFGEGDGYLLGTLDGTGVFVVDNVPAFDETWSDAEKETVSAMQEDLDVIVQDLFARDSFTIAG